MDQDSNRGWKYWVILALVVFAVTNIVGGKEDVDATKTIAVQGIGETYVIQDTAMLSFTVTKTAKDVKVAQDEMNKVVADIVKAVKDLGVEEKNIKTTSYSVYPHYTNEPMPCPYGYCGSSSKTDGFDASQTIEIKTHELEKSGDLISAIGKFNPTNISGIQFVVEDDEAVLREARKSAIEDAKKKAKELAKDLDVRLGKVISFDEGGGRGYPVPMYSMAKDMEYGMGGEGTVNPVIPTGQNKVTSYVTVVYEIK